MKFTVYGNCQSAALAETLMKSDEFKELYEWRRNKFIHMMNTDDITSVIDIFKSVDLLIYQRVSDNYRIPELSTNSLLKMCKSSLKAISFPTIYFNAYFPHLDNFLEKRSILERVHDYIMMYCYYIGLNQKQTIDLIQNSNLYPRDYSLKLLNDSFEKLEGREEGVDIIISDYIKNNYKSKKLFLLFNHPVGVLFDHLANRILHVLELDKIPENILSTTSLDDGMITPVYTSTYKNLDLKFDEDFMTYKTNRGFLQQDEVVSEFYKSFSSYNKDDIISQIQMKKPWIIKMFKEQGIT